MARTNTKNPLNTAQTHGGATVRGITPEQELRRSVMSCMLWENEFYESGVSNANRIAALIPQVEAKTVADIAIEARTKMKLRHVPLFIVREMARHASHRSYVRTTLATVIQRADELAEFVAMYWKDGKQPLAASIKKGLADAFQKFGPYQLAKYNRDTAVKLRDVAFLTHVKPGGRLTEDVLKQLVENTLPTPDTWETALSGGADKKATFERLLSENKLGAMALLRNLRNMEQAGVDPAVIRAGLNAMDTERLLPFRFVAAAQHAKRYEAEIDAAMLRACADMPKLPGLTRVIVDVSGSMYGSPVSKKSDMNRAYAACALAALAREICESVEIYATAGSDGMQEHKTQLVPARHGLPLVDAIYALCQPLGGGGIFLKQCLDWVWRDCKGHMAERVIVITDGQDTDQSAKGVANVRQIAKHQYIVNVASYKNGVGYGAWTEIDGWSEHVLEYIRIAEQGLTEAEAANLQTA